MDFSILLADLMNSKNLFLFLAMAYLGALAIGDIVEKIRVPWIFSALIIGVLLSITGAFSEITSSQTFIDLAKLGMYFLLFIIGFEINLSAYKKHTGFIFKATFVVIFFEAIVGMLMLHYIFGVSWLVSFIASISFAVVGEAILEPILDRFGLDNKPIGRTIIGIGTLDDVIELLIFVLAFAVIGIRLYHDVNILIIFLVLGLLFLLAFGLVKLRHVGRRFAIGNVHHIFLFSLFVFFLFIGIGDFVDSSALAAIMAGVALGNFVPRERLLLIENEVRTMCYGFFAPLFFLWVGTSVDVRTLFGAPLMVLLIIILTTGAKLLATILISRGELTLKESIVVGVGLSVRFGTSIVIIKILYDTGLISQYIYSILIGSSVAITFIVPILFSYLISHWKIAKEKSNYDL